MLGKLMKYEFMAMGRVFLPLYGALIIVSVINMMLGYLGLETPTAIGVFLAVLLILGIMIITFLLVLQRFWTNLLSNEGYLMMTLPVSTDRIILSKLLVASVWNVASTIVVLLSILAMAAPVLAAQEITLAFIVEQIRHVIEMAPFSSLQISILVAQIIIATVVGLFSNILLPYACMALGMISNKHRWLVAIGAYLVITTALQIIVTIFFSIGYVAGLFGNIELLMLNYTTFSQVQIVMLFVIVLEAVLGALFYFITRYMLKNKLNLQ